MKKLYKIFLLLLLPFCAIAQQPQFVIQSGLQSHVIDAAITPNEQYCLTIEYNETLILWDLKLGKQLYSYPNIIFANFNAAGTEIDIVTTDYTFRTINFLGKILYESPVKNKGPDKNSRFPFSKYYNQADLLIASNKFYKKEIGEVAKIYGVSHVLAQKINKILSCGEKDTVLVVNSTNFKEENKIIFTNLKWNSWESDRGIKYLENSQDGNLILAGNKESIEIKDFNTGKTVYSYSLPQYDSYGLYINKATLSPDGKMLVVFTTDKIFMVDIKTNTIVWSLTASLGKVVNYGVGIISFNKDGSKVLLGKDKQLLYLNSANGNTVSSIKAVISDYVNYHDIVNNNLVAVQNTKALHWDLQKGELVKVIPIQLPKESGSGYHVAINKDASSFYNYLFEVNGKTGEKRNFEMGGELAIEDIKPKHLFISDHNKLLLHCASFKSTDNNSLGVSKLVVSNVVTGKIIWQKEGINSGQFNHASTIIAAGVYKRTGSYTNQFNLYDASNGNLIKTITLPEEYQEVRSITFSANDKYLLLIGYGVHCLIEMSSEKIIKLPFQIPQTNEAIRKGIFTADEKQIIFSDNKGNIHFYDIALNSFDDTKKLKAHNINIEGFSITQNGRFVFTNAKENFIKLWDVQTNKQIATLYVNDETSDWAVVTPDGRFDGTKGMQKSMYFLKGLDFIPLESLYEQFFTPHLLARLLAGEILPTPTIDITKLKAAPKVTITLDNAQRNLVVEDDVIVFNSSKEQVTIKVKADCLSDGVTEIRLFQNGKLVGTTRNLVVEDEVTSEKTKIKNFSVTLMQGDNTFKAIALNTERTESNPIEVIVKYKTINIVAPQIPIATTTIHLIVVGINNYKNPKYNLNYALADALSFSEAITKGSKNLFATTNLIFIKDAEATKEGIVGAFSKIKDAAKPQDLFVFYYAGHGVLNDKKEFFLVPHDVTQLYGNDDALAQKGLSSDLLKELSKNILAQKQLFILDACQSAGAISGMAVSRGAAEEKAIAQLARSTGTQWLTASSSDQFASEFSQLGHGAFTYCLLQAFKGDANPTDKKLTVRQLDAYLQDKVPEITEKYKGTKQFPVSFSYGNDFPILIVQ